MGKKKSADTELDLLESDAEESLGLLEEDEEDLNEEELEDESAVAEEPKAIEAPPKKARPRPRSRAEKSAPAAAFSAPSPDPSTQQWESAQRTAQAILLNLDKVGSILKELPEHYASVFQKTLKQAASPRMTPATRVAIALSTVAVVLSVLSLSFSQTARQEVLTRGAAIPAIHERVQKDMPEVSKPQVLRPKRHARRMTQ